MCGLCLPHCPTYVLSRDEGDSPRGRLALIQGLDQGRVAADSERLATHLDRCLGCRACEAMCPSHVPFMALMDQARAEINQVQGMGRYGAPANRLLDLVASPVKMRLASGLARPMGALLRHMPVPGSWARARDLMPRMRTGQLEPQTGDVDGRPIYLFAGCMGDLAERETLASAERVLAALGYSAVQPDNAACCGAMHRHAGRPQEAERLQQRNLRAFEVHPEATILSVATGCSAQLGDYPETFSTRHQEILSFLAQQAWPEKPGLAPLGEKVAIHSPCTQRNVLKDPGSTRGLLERIPGIELADLPLAMSCCGAGGLNLLNQAGIGEALFEESIEWLEQERPRYLVSGNVGCRLHMDAAMRKAGIECEVVHPLALLAQQLSAQ